VAKVTTDVVVEKNDQLLEAVHFLYDDTEDTVVLRLNGVTFYFRSGYQLEMFLHETLKTFWDEAKKLKELAKA